MEDTNGIPQRDTSLFYFTFTYNRYKKNDEGTWEMTNYDEIPTKLCDPSMFSEPEKFIQKQLNDWYCPVFDNIRVGGYWDSSEVSYFRIDVYRCLEGQVNPYTKKPCGKNSDSLAKIYSKYFYSSILQSVLVNPTNYENPLEADYITKYKMLNHGFLKRELIFIKEFKVTSDYGWIFQTSNSTSMLGLDSVENDILNLDPETGILHYETRIYFDKKQNSFYREYVKVQKLAAEVGGILKLFVTIAAVITDYYNSYYLNYDLANHFISPRERDKFNDYFHSKYFNWVKHAKSDKSGSEGGGGGSFTIKNNHKKNKDILMKPNYTEQGGQSGNKLMLQSFNENSHSNIMQNPIELNKQMNKVNQIKGQSQFLNPKVLAEDKPEGLRPDKNQKGERMEGEERAKNKIKIKNSEAFNKAVFNKEDPNAYNPSSGNNISNRKMPDNRVISSSNELSYSENMPSNNNNLDMSNKMVAVPNNSKVPISDSNLGNAYTNKVWNKPEDFSLRISPNNISQQGSSNSVVAYTGFKSNKLGQSSMMGIVPSPTGNGPIKEELNRREDVEQGEKDNPKNEYMTENLKIADINECINRISLRIQDEKEKKNQENVKILPLLEYIYTSIPHPFRCSKEYRDIHKNAVVKTANKYLDTLISVETLIDSRILLNKMKEVLFNKDQLHLVNYIPNKDYETFYTNTYGDNYETLFSNKNNLGIFESKAFVLSLRNHLTPKEGNSEYKVIKRVVSAAQIKEKGEIDSRIVKGYF
mmetsp:Transcript_27949/g.29131  ORF Transcript_27949/g.29131 Transcript_27949/m.29131 type:complete len:755 (+) Transcript_27949:251-2515(+)